MELSALEKILIDKIAEEGPLSIADFMEQALVHPEHGYYMRRDPFGVDGDFITAPEISQMFGELLGLWTAINWQAMGQPETFNLVELGPGRGTLMADMLRAAGIIAGFSEAVRVHLVEASPVLREMQVESLKPFDLVQPVQWHDQFQQVPGGPLIVIANEFFDALPINQYFRTGDYWCPRVVDAKPDGDGLCFVLLPPHDTPDLPPGLKDSPNDKVVEVCPAALELVEAISGRIATDGGAALIVDYGHSEGGSGETLQAIRKHTYHNVLDNPGEADITAHVDFAALGQRVFASGARAHGAVPQGRFLQLLGIAERAKALAASATEEQVEDLGSALKRLVDTDEMGELFKVMAITRLDFPVPPGFE
ncbi:MAG: class I SAM-dependent methyltransferase [Rhodospirillaceae bacterium]|jgi:NADH dehydrogenase [ubiquinone] 1 alpha subcomplex assembly factor 7|nr:class I SAM-dependent methyltransferase [Rhodospirillaceae bacterium]MBT4218585.1 class I SAM-dependent methyltransferase [Rhodospirillaceae bacterium]MBT4464507.1 class I SAM-dependent methyltransferase [Rhodospirillaceae bacterium]MBT5012882.1 class I SAM-dependent methyltransferase [Rhodospirillaceae bacterium]MBT5307890.1 class I SAM-dependent methyltransferase [Rhodospirillaceae bacterium]